MTTSTDIVTNRSSKQRHKQDFYKTPPLATLAFIRACNWSEAASVWDPAAGEGHLVDVFNACNWQKTITSDINSGEDFLLQKELRADFICTNPPFRLAAEFIEHAWKLRPNGFAFLLKANYWNAAKRGPLFRQYPPQKIMAVSWRLDFTRAKGAPPMDCIWVEWNPLLGKRQTTTFCTLPRPQWYEFEKWRMPKYLRDDVDEGF